MRLWNEDDKPKRRPINLTIREDVIGKAKSLDLNASQAAERGILESIRQEQERRWREENRTAIAERNARVEREGLPLKPLWLAD